MKRNDDRHRIAFDELLLARGACIETARSCLSATNSACCSSQEEHVLKLVRGVGDCRVGMLLLARGACIETPEERGAGAGETCCSSQEEHVLKPYDVILLTETPQLLLARGACIETFSQALSRQPGELLLARGACIETVSPYRRLSACLVAPRKRSMY